MGRAFSNGTGESRGVSTVYFPVAPEVFRGFIVPATAFVRAVMNVSIRFFVSTGRTSIRVDRENMQAWELGLTLLWLVWRTSWGSFRNGIWYVGQVVGEGKEKWT